MDFLAITILLALEQQHAENKMHIIACASHCCFNADAKYGSNEGELLALVFKVPKLHHYLAGSVFTITRNNGNLQYIEIHKQCRLKLTQWAMLLSNYDFKVCYCLGWSNSNGD